MLVTDDGLVTDDLVTDHGLYDREAFCKAKNHFYLLFILCYLFYLTIRCKIVISVF